MDCKSLLELVKCLTDLMATLKPQVNQMLAALTAEEPVQ